MEEASKKLGKKIVTILWIEMGILLVIGLIGLSTTMQVVHYDGSFRMYYLIDLVGIAFVAVLYILAEKGIKWVWLLGIPFIVIFAVVTWLGYVPSKDRARAVERYEELVGQEIVVEVDGVTYDWNGYHTIKDEDIRSHTREKQVKANVGEEEQSWTVYYDSAEDVVYSTGATGESKYLMILKKKE